MRLGTGARVGVVGAGPGGLATAKHAVEAGLDVTVFEASDDLGGQWHTTAAHSGVWPGMRTNTSRMMTAFSDFPPPPEHELYPFAEQVQRYLRAYAAAHGVVQRIRFETRVDSVEPVGSGWRIDGEPFDAVVIASGRFRKPSLPEHLHAFTGELLHAFDYAGNADYRDRRVLVYGNGVSGHEIASDIALVSPVISAYRKPRYVLQKVVDGVPSDWRWYTQASAMERRLTAPQTWGARLRQRVVEVNGHPSDFGAPSPDDDILIAGHSLCQDYLAQVRDGDISCRPAITGIDGRRVTFTDGHTEAVDAIICATGYDIDLPYLADDVRRVLGQDLRLHLRTFQPALEHLALVGQFALQGPYLPLLELQARWIVGVWTGALTAPDEQAMRASVATAPPEVDAHHLLALELSEAAGVSPDLDEHPDLAEALLFGPMLPPRYRLDGPGQLSNARELFVAQLATSTMPPVTADDVSLLATLGAVPPAATPSS